MIVDSTAVLQVAIPSAVTGLGLWLNYNIQKHDREKGKIAAELKSLQEAEIIREEQRRVAKELAEKVVKTADAQNVVLDEQNVVLGEIHTQVNSNLQVVVKQNKAILADNEGLRAQLKLFLNANGVKKHVVPRPRKR